MASATQPTTTYDVPNYTGPLLWSGLNYGRAPILGLAGRNANGLPNRYRVVSGSQFAMANIITGDAGTQDGQTEDASIAATTITSYAASQTTNYVQIFHKSYAVSYAAMALGGNISGVANIDDPRAQISSMGVQREAHLKQMVADYEESLLYGASSAWTNAATAGTMYGVLTAVEAGSETAAAGAALSKSLINTEIARMATAEAEFGNMLIAANAFQLQQLTSLYGNSMQSTTIAGVELQSLYLPIAGRCTVIYDPAINTDDLAFLDLNHLMPVFGIVPGKPPVFTEPLGKIAGADHEMMYSLASFDYGSIQYHGMVSGLATS